MRRRDLFRACSRLEWRARRPERREGTGGLAHRPAVIPPRAEGGIPSQQRTGLITGFPVTKSYNGQSPDDSLFPVKYR